MKYTHQAPKLLAALALVMLLAACFYPYDIDRDGEHGRYDGDTRYGDSYGHGDHEHGPSARGHEGHGDRR
jgi:hypothetical protein